MTLVAWSGPYCLTMRDCECCGARGGLVCRERFEHPDVHAFQCQYCGRDKGCYN